MDDNFGFTDALTSGFQQALWTERRLQHKDGVASLCFCFDQPARGFAANLFVGCPQKHKFLCKRDAALLDGIESEERLDDACLHVEHARTEYAARSGSKRHFGQRSAGIDSVVVSEYQKLGSRLAFARGPGNAKMRSAT